MFLFVALALAKGDAQLMPGMLDLDSAKNAVNSRHASPRSLARLLSNQMSITELVQFVTILNALHALARFAEVLWINVTLITIHTCVLMALAWVVVARNRGPLNQKIVLDAVNYLRIAKRVKCQAKHYNHQPRYTRKLESPDLFNELLHTALVSYRVCRDPFNGIHKG